MAASTRSLGMLTPLAFCMAARRRRLESGLGPPAFTAITISRPMRVKSFAIWPQRFILRAFRNSNARPMVWYQCVVVGQVVGNLKLGAQPNARPRPLANGRAKVCQAPGNPLGLMA